MERMKTLDRPPVPIPLAFAPGFRPPAYRPRLAQPWVEVKPQVTIEQPKIEAPINISLGLGGLPLSIGLFAGSGVSFLIRSAVPQGWPQTVATVAGVALALGGVGNLIFPKAPPAPAPAAAPAGPPPPPPPPSGAAAPENKPAGYVPPSVPAFTRVQIEMISPAPDQEISHTGTFFGIGTPKIPVQLRLYNPTAESVSFNLEFEWDETPSLMGYNQSPSHGSKAFQVTLAPNEERNDSFDLPMVVWLSNATTVALELYKKRTPNENRFLVLSRIFNVT